MIAIIDYKAGNRASVKNALERLGKACLITSNPQEILAADGVIFPGQGRAGSAMQNLKEAGIAQILPTITQPFLGICLGMQLLAEFSAEDQTQCMGIFQGQCRKFPSILKTPHLGWNKVELTGESPLTADIQDGAYFYFVHSYYVDCLNNDVIGKTSYGFEFPAIMQKKNFFAVQFHPEKSGKQGLQLLNNFCELCL